MVRLKDEIWHAQDVSDSLFQFLMVRLKEIKGKLLNSQPYVISIPYGAIKSMAFAGDIWRQDNISIPYGAIKRNLTYMPTGWQHLISIPYGAIKSSRRFKAHQLDENRFQFLMVRLKAWTSKRMSARRSISIPYGAIKRSWQRPTPTKKD